ncbi:MAG TPA: hypothetical protein VGW76_12380 [Pyrinomonadaceae bacterium]|nr:hypothetical protein [Pyrinomonadaceae bacterium]
MIVSKQDSNGPHSARQLQALVSCSDRLSAEDPIKFNGLSVTTNRRFDVIGREVTGDGENPDPNAFTKLLFEEQNGDLSPVSEWTVEFPLADDANKFLKAVSASDAEEYGFGEIEDVVLVMEYDQAGLDTSNS